MMMQAEGIYGTYGKEGAIPRGVVMANNFLRGRA